MTLKIAIVGRPNVGKSTLFNRLAGKKLAIVDDQPGVTRDRRYARGRLGDLDLDLIDTAGFEDVSDESLETRMRHQTELALEEADLALFIMDAREGVVPLDEIFAELLRRKQTSVVMIANKAEGAAGRAGAHEAHRLGFGEPIHLSAEHGEGISELYEAVEAHRRLIEGDDLIADDFDDEDDESKPIRIAIIGRPNAGKSTLINRLIGEDRLLTGPEAGITRDSISVDWQWDGRPVRLVDTAGLRRKARVQERLEKLSTADTIRAITFAEVVVLMMDQANAFETQDLQIADLVEREGRALIFALSKWDLVEEPQARLAELSELAERMLPQLRGAPLVALSAHSGRGLDRLMPAITKVYKNWSAKVKTRDLNDWLALAVQRHPPPAVDGKRIKPKYMAQIKARPPTFVLFASRASQLPDSYRRYLINSIRESFDLPGVPIRVTIKSNSNPYAMSETDAATAPSVLKSRAAKAAKEGKPKPTRAGARKTSAPTTKPAHPGRVRQKPVSSASVVKPRGSGKVGVRTTLGRPSTSKTGARPGGAKGPGKSGPKR